MSKRYYVTVPDELAMDYEYLVRNVTRNSKSPTTYLNELVLQFVVGHAKGHRLPSTAIKDREAAQEPDRAASAPQPTTLPPRQAVEAPLVYDHARLAKDMEMGERLERWRDWLHTGGSELTDAEFEDMRATADYFDLDPNTLKKNN